MFHDCMSSMQADGFRDLVLVGSGTQGSVYGSFDEKLDRMVVVKKIDASTPSQQEQLKNEIIALRGRTHPHIQPILYALLRPQMTLVVTLPARGNIHTIMPMRYDLVTQTSAFYTMTVQLLSALDFLEREGISHGNIKPTNVLVVETATRYRCFVFQLVDFAYAQGTYEAPPHNCRSAAAAAAIYKAPETCCYAESSSSSSSSSYYPLGPKEDVWSLFVTLAVACGRLSEAELIRRGLVAASRDVVEAGVQMSELEDMARLNPMLRASAREVLAHLMPESLEGTDRALLGERGEAGCTEFNDAESYGYIDGPYDLSSTPSPRASPAPGPPMYEQYTHLPPVDSSPDASPPLSMNAMSPPPPPYSPPYPFQQALQPLEPQPQSTTQHHAVGQRCLESCCNTPRSLPAWTTSASISATILTSISVTARLAPYKPLSPIAPSFFPVSSARQTSTTQQASLTETWSIWGVYGSRDRNSANDANRVNHQNHHHHHHHDDADAHIHHVSDDNVNLPPLDMNRRWEYVRPYPIACDSPPEQEVEEDSQSVSEGGSSWSDSTLGYVP
ncbi:kinase-like protein [Trichoderma citrinoviride]|uniref:Kinase-like protein n=1 Tax=Trichoderma citrinoviride TaxID=58853 RepID=A0A2T4BGZ2_9HYPO|nr:kinase-like protein [Trichoderma citrinoviride]PTB68587.1 kinase-like protein [Trichoderma citrinoviride]